MNFKDLLQYTKNNPLIAPAIPYDISELYSVKIEENEKYVQVIFETESFGISENCYISETTSVEDAIEECCKMIFLKVFLRGCKN